MTRAEKIRTTKSDDEMVEQIMKVKCSRCGALSLDEYGELCCLYDNVESCEGGILIFLNQEVEE